MVADTLSLFVNHSGSPRAHEVILPRNLPVCDAARIVGGWFGYEPAYPSFKDGSGQILDRSKTLLDLGLQPLSTVEYFDTLSADLA